MAEQASGKHGGNGQSAEIAVANSSVVPASIRSFFIMVANS